MQYNFSIFIEYINKCTYKYSLLQTHTHAKIIQILRIEEGTIKLRRRFFVCIHSKQLHTFNVVQTTNTTATCLDMMYPNNPA